MPVLELRCFYVSQFSIAYPCEEIFCYCLLLTWNKKSLRFVFKIHWYWHKRKLYSLFQKETSPAMSSPIFIKLHPQVLNVVAFRTLVPSWQNLTAKLPDCQTSPATLCWEELKHFQYTCMPHRNCSKYLLLIVWSILNL